MKLGQIPENVYFRSVMKGIEYNNDNIKGGVVSKETCAFFMDDEIVFSESKNASLKELNGTMALYSCVNALLAKGAIPKAVNINMLMPHRFAEERLKNVIESFNVAAKECDVTVSTFAGEMLNELTETVISADAVGYFKDKEKEKNIEVLNDGKKATAGCDIVMTKWAGMAATAVLAINKREELVKRFSASYVDGMEELKAYMSLKKEAEFIFNNPSARQSAVILCKEISKGGIYKALWELGSRCGSGLIVNLKSIPVKQETIEVCNYYDLNPYEIYSEGSMLILCHNGEELVEKMLENSIQAAVIGKLTDDNDRVVINDYERKFLTKPCSDEMTKIII